MKFWRRLRWQLTFSHLLATAFTLVSMIAAIVVLASAAIATQSNETRQPGSDARSVAAAIGGLVEAHADASELGPVLHGMADGNLRLTVGLAGPGRGLPFQFGLSNVAYIVLLDPDGAVLASSDPSGANFAPPERDEWTSILGTRDGNGTTVLRSGGAPAAFGGAPINGQDGAQLATVVLAVTSLPPPGGGGFDVLRVLAIFGFASVAVLVAASLFALASSGVVAILLTRRLAKRLERLGSAAQQFAHGELALRVDPGPNDELGRLARQFNSMASDLERTLGELRAERDRVTGLLDDRRQLVASASHELRTPVATVRGYLESALARAEDLPPGLRGDLGTMEGELIRLQQLIEDLFALSQAAVGKLSLRIEPVDSAAVVQHLVETAAPLAWGQRRVQLIAESNGDVPAVLADRQRLEQIISNVLGNAIRHTPPGGLVAARLYRQGNRVSLEVRDTGEGIRPEDLPHVFERFFRGQSENGRGGAGLGLALVKELAEAMGGSVEASSTPGEGSVFTVRFNVSVARDGAPA